MSAQTYVYIWPYTYGPSAPKHARSDERPRTDPLREETSPTAAAVRIGGLTCVDCEKYCSLFQIGIHIGLVEEMKLSLDIRWRGFTLPFFALSRILDDVPETCHSLARKHFCFV